MIASKSRYVFKDIARRSAHESPIRMKGEVMEIRLWVEYYINEDGSDASILSTVNKHKRNVIRSLLSTMRFLEDLMTIASMRSNDPHT